MCSVIDCINYGAGNSTLQKCNVKCHIMRGNRVARGSNGLSTTLSTNEHIPDNPQCNCTDDVKR